jgi:hypothetical protein
MRHASDIARGIAGRFVPALGNTVRCGGCGCSKDEVTHMVAGPNVYLCDRCIEQAGRQITPRTPAPDAVRCRFCRQLRAKDDVTVVGNVSMCAECVGLTVAILAEAAQASGPTRSRVP